MPLFPPSRGAGVLWSARELNDLTDMSVFETVAAMALHTGGATGDKAWLDGHSTTLDGGEGLFIYDAAMSQLLDNGGTIVADAGSGCWSRQYTGSASVKWFGAKGDTTDGTDGTDDYAAILAAATAHKSIYFPAGKYRVSQTLITPQADCIWTGDCYGKNSYTSALIPEPALTGFVVRSQRTADHFTMIGLSIDGKSTTNADGGIYLKDDGGSLNNHETLRNLSVVNFLKSGAIGIHCEAWNPHSKNIYIRNIDTGTGIKLGGGGATTTTVEMHGVYIGECDTCVAATGSITGIHLIDFTAESSVIGVFSQACSIKISGGHFENMNTVNSGGTNKSSLVYTSLDTSSAVEHWLHVESVTTSIGSLSMDGMYIGALNATGVQSKFLHIGASCNCSFKDCQFPDGDFNSTTVTVRDDSNLTMYSPRNIDLAQARGICNSIYGLVGASDGATYRIEKDRAHSVGDALGNSGVVRKLYDTHDMIYSDDYPLTRFFVDRAGSIVTTATASSGTKVLTVASGGADFVAGDYVGVKVDSDNLYFFDTVASSTATSITLTNNLSYDSLSGSTAYRWSWKSDTPIALVGSPTAVVAGSNVNILSFSSNQTSTFIFQLVGVNNNAAYESAKITITHLAGIGPGVYYISEHLEPTFVASTVTASVAAGVMTVNILNNNTSTGYGMTYNLRLIQMVQCA